MNDRKMTTSSERSERNTHKRKRQQSEQSENNGKQNKTHRENFSEARARGNDALVYSNGDVLTDKDYPNVQSLQISRQGNQTIYYMDHNGTYICIYKRRAFNVQKKRSQRICAKEALPFPSNKDNFCVSYSITGSIIKYNCFINVNGEAIHLDRLESGKATFNPIRSDQEVIAEAMVLSKECQDKLNSNFLNYCNSISMKRAEAADNIAPLTNNDEHSPLDSAETTVLTMLSGDVNLTDEEQRPDTQLIVDVSRQPPNPYISTPKMQNFYRNNTYAFFCKINAALMQQNSMEFEDNLNNVLSISEEFQF